MRPWFSLFLLALAAQVAAAPDYHPPPRQLAADN